MGIFTKRDKIAKVLQVEETPETEIEEQVDNAEERIEEAETQEKRAKTNLTEEDIIDALINLEDRVTRIEAGLFRVKSVI